MKKILVSQSDIESIKIKNIYIRSNFFEKIFRILFRLYLYHILNKYIYFEKNQKKYDEKEFINRIELNQCKEHL